MSEDRPQDDADLLGTAVRQAWTRVLARSRTEVLRAADEGRNRIRSQLLQRDLDALRVRLGKTAFRLFEEGEIEHPAIAKAALRIREIEDELVRLRSSTMTESE